MDNQSFNDLIKLSSYSAKISSMLAQENISAEFSDAARTASYDVTARKITFPYSTAFMDHDIHELFMFHEISHAIHFSYEDFMHEKKSDVEHDCMNIVLDIRDERLIKQRYPGSLSVFSRGYEKLVEQGFFGDKNTIKLKGFPDRLNVFAKCGMSSSSWVPLTNSEMKFYERCMRAVTVQDVIELSLELEKMQNDYIYDAEQAREMLQEILNEASDDEVDEASLLDELDQRLDELRQQRVQEVFDDNFEKSILNNARVINAEPIPMSYSQMSSAKSYVKYIKTMRIDNSDIDMAQWTNDIRSMRKDIRTSVDSMVRVFESRKAAEKARNAKISDTGLIDVNKVHRYKFDNEIFRRSVQLPNSKNHAYFILVDFSGSMHKQMDNVFQQLIVITEFFRSIQVPYKVCGFGQSVMPEIFMSAEVDYYQTSTFFSYSYNRDNKVMPASLFEILNSEQSILEHNIALTGLMKRVGYSLGNTPTVQAVCAAENQANIFFNKTRATKRHMIVITDGEPTDCPADSRYGKTVIVADPVSQTKIVYRGNAPYGHCNAIGKIIENRSNIKFTTISITSSLSDSITSSFVTGGVHQKNTEEFRKIGYTRVSDPFTRNPIFFAKPMAVDTGVDDFDITDKKTTSQIARVMISNMKHVNKSRNFLNALAETLS